jgi:EAL domain-containing protein (putative c-di-GMP-specific phosphodiesterase class I)
MLLAVTFAKAECVATELATATGVSVAFRAAALSDPEQTPKRILVVDDSEDVLRALTRLLTSVGYTVDTASNGASAIGKLASNSFDVLISDIHLTKGDAFELLESARKRDLDMSVVLMTSVPDVSTAVLAIEHGAVRYLVKPILPSELLPIVAHACRMSLLARLKRTALCLAGDSATFFGDRAGLAVSFSQAFETMSLAYQPIVSWSEKKVYAYEALLRTGTPTLGSASAMLAAAERLGRVHELGRAIRKAAASAVSPGHLLFVNLHTRDLEDEELFSKEAPLSRHASNVVLEITERACLDEIGQIQSRLQVLRNMGFRIALDDLGTGYAGLTSLAQLQPEIVMLDMSLVRDVDTNLVKRKLVESMTSLARDMGMEVILEGVETVSERDVLVKLGCDLFQGYLFAKPETRFPLVAW